MPIRSIYSQPRPFRLALGAVVLIAFVMRVLMQYDRAWQGDEWGSILALDVSYGELLRHFGGWYTMNFYLAGLKAISQLTGDRHWMLVLPGIVCGCWLVVLAAALALRLSGPRAALAAALLVASNPFLVTYSTTIRSYIVLATLCSAMFLLMLDWRRLGKTRDAILFAVLAATALLSHLNATYAFAAMAVIGLLWLIQRQVSVAKLALLALPTAILVALAAAAYVPQLADIRAFRSKWSDTSPTSLFFLPVFEQTHASAPDRHRLIAATDCGAGEIRPCAGCSAIGCA